MTRLDWLLRLTACSLVAIQHHDGPGIDSVARISHVECGHSGGNVVWSGKRSVHGAEPASMYNPGDEWKFKLQGLPICVDRDVTHPCACEVVHGQCETVRVPSPVRLSNFNAVPLDAALLEVILQRCLSSRSFLVEMEAEIDQQPYEAQQVCIGVTQTPVEPAGCVVLAICVVIS